MSAKLYFFLYCAFWFSIYWAVGTIIAKAIMWALFSPTVDRLAHWLERRKTA